MIFTGDRKPQVLARWRQYATSAWYSLRNPKLTGTLVAIIAVVIFLGLVIPQQPASSPDAAIWISTLPTLIQFWGEPLYLLGFAQIFQSVWLWLPVALLLLNSLIAVADYWVGSRYRLQKTVPPIDWQHPLGGRSEQIVRLTKSPDELLTTLQTSLTSHKFYIYQPAESQQRMIGAARRRGAWLGVESIYVGLILLIVAVLVSHYLVQTDRLTLFPAETKASPLFDGQFELIPSGAAQEQTWLVFWPDSREDSPLAFAGRLFQPALFKNVVILPIAREPIVMIEVRDETNALLRLVPIQEEFAPAERLSLPLPDPETHLYVLIPAVDLAVQIALDPNSSSNEYNVQVRHSSDETPTEIMVQAGETFPVGELRVTISDNYNLSLLAYYDPALLLYIAGGFLIILGLLLTLVPFLSPIQVWLVPEIKGLGGQLYGVIETYGAEEKAEEFLKQLLTPETTSPNDEQESVILDSE